MKLAGCYGALQFFSLKKDNLSLSRMRLHRDKKATFHLSSNLVYNEQRKHTGPRILCCSRKSCIEGFGDQLADYQLQA